MNEETEIQAALVKLQGAYPESPFISIDVKNVMRCGAFKKDYYVYVFFERGGKRKAALGIGDGINTAICDMEIDLHKMKMEGVI